MDLSERDSHSMMGDRRLQESVDMEQKPSADTLTAETTPGGNEERMVREKDVAELTTLQKQAKQREAIRAKKRGTKL
jgi:hypothetical protein